MAVLRLGIVQVHSYRLVCINSLPLLSRPFFKHPAGVFRCPVDADMNILASCVSWIAAQSFSATQPTPTARHCIDAGDNTLDVSWLGDNGGREQSRNGTGVEVDSDESGCYGRR